MRLLDRPAPLFRAWAGASSRRRTTVWISVMGLIFLGSAWGGIPGKNESVWLAALYNMPHVPEYGLLGMAAWIALQGRPDWVAWAAGAFYGVTDEFHQSLVTGRDASLGDLAIDAVSVAWGIWAIRCYVTARTPSWGVMLGFLVLTSAVAFADAWAVTG